MAKYIDADVLLQNFKKQYGEDLGWQCPVNMSDVGMMIEDAPTADVQVVRHGEWHLHPDGSGTCSLCGRTQKAVWDFDNAQEYCGKCGADMRGDKNDV